MAEFLGQVGVVSGQMRVELLAPGTGSRLSGFWHSTASERIVIGGAD